MSVRSQRDISPDLSDLLDQLSARTMGQMRVSLPGIVSSYDHATQRAVVEVAITERDGTKIAPITDVPVCFYRAGGYLMRGPVAQGDTGWLTFADRDIGSWLKLGGFRPPDSSRRFDWSDAIFLPCLAPENNALSYPSGENDHLVIAREDGAAVLRLEDGKVTVDAGTEILLGDGASQFVALASLVKAEIDALKATFDSHTHLYSPGPGAAIASATPLPASTATGNMGAAKVKAE